MISADDTDKKNSDKKYFKKLGEYRENRTA